jgi:hypothetical protein
MQWINTQGILSDGNLSPAERRDAMEYIVDRVYGQYMNKANEKMVKNAIAAAMNAKVAETPTEDIKGQSAGANAVRQELLAPIQNRLDWTGAGKTTWMRGTNIARRSLSDGAYQYMYNSFNSGQVPTWEGIWASAIANAHKYVDKGDYEWLYDDLKKFIEENELLKDRLGPVPTTGMNIPKV